MTDLIDSEPEQARDMNDDEQLVADMVYSAIQRYSAGGERGQQAAEFRVGVSDLGYCSERTRRMLKQEVPEDTDLLLAFLGTAIGDHVEKAIVEAYPSALSQFEVTVPLHGDRGQVYNVTGHPDLLMDNMLLDVKTNFGLALARRLGADQQKRFQRHCYALGAHRAGLFGDIPLEDVQVGNIWVDRSGVEKQVHVQLEPFSMEVVEGAARWLDEVIHAYVSDSEAMKEPPREVCAATCGFFATCRGLDTDVSGLLTDPLIVEAVRMYKEGSSLEKEGKSLRSQAKAVLEGVEGSTGEFTLRWVHVNETVVPETRRRAYSRPDIRPIKK
jgi:hypothetical protein